MKGWTVSIFNNINDTVQRGLIAKLHRAKDNNLKMTKPAVNKTIYSYIYVFINLCTIYCDNDIQHMFREPKMMLPTVWKPCIRLSAKILIDPN